MNTTMAVDAEEAYLDHKPGAQLALLRSQKGYTTEYAAGKLHLRIHLIELLEADEYDKMPEPVFIKGYLRAYAKLLEISPEPFIETFNRFHLTERKVDRALWQSRKRSYKTYKAENTVRWITIGMTVLVLAAVLMWWTKTRDDQMSLSAAETGEEITATKSSMPTLLPSLENSSE